MTLCECGCIQETKPNKRYIHGHNSKFPAKGEYSVNWKGDNISIGWLHRWIKERLPEPKFCSNCGEHKRLELANTGKYNREFKNWKYLCSSCHHKYDGMIKNIISKPYTPWWEKLPKAKIDMSNRFCKSCGSKETYMMKNHRGLIRPKWYHHEDGFLCRMCFRSSRS